jgi:hypothetical protein
MFGQILVGTYPNRPHMFHRAFSYSEVQNKQVGKNKQVHRLENANYFI